MAARSYTCNGRLDRGRTGVLTLTMLAVTLRLLWRDGKVAVSAALFSLSVFTFATGMHERYLFPAILFMALAPAVTRSLWLPYTVLSVNFFFNLITIAPFTNWLGINLVATSDTSLTTRTLQWLALVVASANVVLVLWLWHDGRTRARPAGALDFDPVRRLWGLVLRIRSGIAQRFPNRASRRTTSPARPRAGRGTALTVTGLSKVSGRIV